MKLDFIKADIESYIKQQLKYAIIEILDQYIEDIEYKQDEEWDSAYSFERSEFPVSGLFSIPELKSSSVPFFKKEGETFSQMLVRLIEESGEKNSTIYARANIDRRLFSKIVNNENYQPSKQTALAFAIALKLNYGQTQKLLASAGFVLSKSLMFDIIISYFIEHSIFDVDLINQVLYEHNQGLLGC